jgi:hypothetical protein
MDVCVVVLLLQSTDFRFASDTVHIKAEPR